MLKVIPFILVSSIGLAACAEAPRPAGEVYRSSEANQIMQGQVCTIVSARQVAVVGDGFEDQQRNTLTSGVGIVTGALIGRAVGGEMGNGDGRKLTRSLGTIGGAVAGAAIAGNANAARTTRQGVQYQVRTGSHTRVVVQEVGPGERIMPSGSGCLLVSGRGGARVVPQ